MSLTLGIIVKTMFSLSIDARELGIMAECFSAALEQITIAWPPSSCPRGSRCRASGPPGRRSRRSRRWSTGPSRSAGRPARTWTTCSACCSRRGTRRRGRG